MFKLLARGLDAKQVSQKITITPKTAHVHRANIMTKLNLTSQMQLTKLALAENVICIEDLN
ncbi:LuxR C-terminal-related transcriptional regulator [Pseudoalteromonas atlantica]|uniref:LuxR C-terminal-related transcriptional regulator n=1 Tax=Pseudoalteromonas atlantica TaxID=288 RepID=UPI003A97C0EA